MDLKLLKAFVAVADLGTVSKAADFLHVTQPALSRQIGSLEHQAGFKLFERAGRRLALTPRGEQFLGECRGMLSHASIFDQRAQELRRGDLQLLRIAAPALTIEALFPDFMGRYADRVAGVRLILLDVEAADHLDMLERGEADLSVNVINMVPIDRQRFAVYVLPRFHMRAAFAPAFGMAPGEAIDIAALADRPLLVLDTSYATRNVFDAACHLADFKPNIYFESRSVNALLAIAAAGHGIAIIPSVLRTDPDRLRTLRVTHRGEPLELTAAVIWDRRRTPARHAEQFSGLLAGYIQDTYSPPPVADTGARGRKRQSRAAQAEQS